MAGCFICQSVGMLGMNFIPGFLGIVLFLSFYAPTYAGVLPLLPALQADYFGRDRFGTIRGLMTPIALMGTVIGATFAGIVKDLTGTYQMALTIFAVANLLSLTFILLTRRPKLPSSRPSEEVAAAT